jgi:hypothetical protein
MEYRHINGELSTVRINNAVMGLRTVCTANFPPEVSDGLLWAVLSRYGAVKVIQAETWSRQYRYPVANGILLAWITLTIHIPSHVTVAGNRGLLSYEGQPTTCDACNDTGHLYQVCGGECRRRRPHPNKRHGQT